MHGKHFFLLVLAWMIMTMTFSAFAAEETVLSPDGSLAVTVTVDGGITYTVAKDGDAVLHGKIGLTTGAGAYPASRTLTGTTRRTIDETLQMYSGSYSSIRNHANEMTLTLSGGYTVTVRAYNDGMAFRQTLTGSGSTTVSADDSTFVIPAASDTWAVTEDVTTTNIYERNYTKQKVEEFPENAYFPLLYNTGDIWCFLTEADLFSTHFSGSTLIYADGTFGM